MEKPEPKTLEYFLLAIASDHSVLQSQSYANFAEKYQDWLLSQEATKVVEKAKHKLGLHKRE